MNAGSEGLAQLNASISAGGEILAILKEEIPGLSEEDMAKPLDQLSIDSFGLVALRARLERHAKREISDEAWTSANSLADILALLRDAQETRSYHLNMPQMAMQGLSESWLFKELGDMHWSMTTSGLRCPSSELLDGAGNRLYATFTRIRISCAPLARYRENDDMVLQGSLSRFGAGIFLSEFSITGGDAQLMSSFSKRAESGSNISLLKGQPLIPAGCTIPVLDRLPAFGMEYRTHRAASPPEPIFQSDYHIVPQHDINGVGLLYFAAYPIIADICEERHASQRALTTTHRDVFYFNNCDPNETLLFKLHRRTVSASGVESESSLSRKSDGAMMAYLVTRKETAQ